MIVRGQPVLITNAKRYSEGISDCSTAGLDSVG
jgi:hypothetical protein